MKKLNETQAKKHDELFQALQTAQEKIEDIEAKINHLIDTELTDAIAAFNARLHEAYQFHNEVVAIMDAYIETKDEAWAETDAGSQYIEWKDDWEQADFEQVPLVDEISVHDFQLVDQFGSLDTEPR